MSLSKEDMAMNKKELREALEGANEDAEYWRDEAATRRQERAVLQLKLVQTEAARDRNGYQVLELQQKLESSSAVRDKLAAENEYLRGLTVNAAAKEHLDSLTKDADDLRNKVFCLTLDLKDAEGKRDNYKKRLEEVTELREHSRVGERRAEARLAQLEKGLKATQDELYKCESERVVLAKEIDRLGKALQAAGLDLKSAVEKGEAWRNSALNSAKDKGIETGRAAKLERTVHNLSEVLAWMIASDRDPEGNYDAH